MTRNTPRNTRNTPRTPSGHSRNSSSSKGNNTRNTRNTPTRKSNNNLPEESERKGISKGQRYRRDAGDAAGAFMQFWRKTKEESAVPTKYKELMQLAIVLTQHCRPCINLHTQICVQVGCSREEIMDAANIALAMGGGPVFSCIGDLMQALDEYLPPGPED